MITAGKTVTHSLNFKMLTIALQLQFVNESIFFLLLNYAISYKIRERKVRESFILSKAQQKLSNIL